MTQILICTVGGQPQPVINAVNHTPGLDFVYFLCSTGDTPTASDVFVELGGLVGRDIRCRHCEQIAKPAERVPSIVSQTSLRPDQYRIERIDSPDDFGEVLAVCRQLKRDISDRFEDGVQVFANYTGGTKTMSFGLGVFALREGWILQFNTTGDTRPNTIRIEEGDFPMRQDASALQADDALRLSEKLEKSFNFEGAASVLSEALFLHTFTREDGRQLAEARRRCEILAARDRFDYAQAQALGRQDPSLKSALGRLKKTVEILDDPTKPWPGGGFSGLELVEDLCQNADRCASRGRFDDAVGRLYRATELLAQIRLRSKYGLSTSNVDLSNPSLDSSTLKWLENHRRHRKGDGDAGPVQLGLIAGYELLVILRDELGRHFEENKPQLLGLIEKRNHSYFAHGLKPIDSAQWREIGGPWRDWLNRGRERLTESVAAGKSPKV